MKIFCRLFSAGLLCGCLGLFIGAEAAPPAKYISSVLPTSYAAEGRWQADPISVYDSIMDNIRQVQWGNIASVSSLNTTVAGLVSSLQSDGSWMDVDYASTAQTSWSPLTHLTRLKNMALAASNAASSYYNNIELCSKIQLALEYWYTEDPRSSNWFNQQISCPKAVGEILILMRGTAYPISSILENNLLDRMASIGGNPSNSYSVGGSSNKINISCHWIYRGCLREDATVLERGADSAMAPVRIQSPSQGIQVDYSYQEHGKQLYIANYGTVFIDNVSNIALYFAGTSYALAGAKLSILSNYARSIYINSIRGQYSTFSAPGRQIANKSKLYIAEDVAILERMKQLDPTQASLYDSVIARWSGAEAPSFGIRPKHTHYWISDYSTHTRTGYNFDVRFISSRTERTEEVNDENLKGHFLSDGATNMTVTGDEYFNIFPSWDWSRIPGVTAPHVASLPNLSDRLAGTASFAGGVSDSLYGVSVYQLDYPKFKITGKKSWFFFDDEIVCLGADIKSTATEEVNTTLNQSLQSGPVTVSDGSVHAFAFGQSQEYDGNLQWALHNGFGYVFPNGGKVGISNQVQSGNWYTISHSQTAGTVNNNVFSLWINHGAQPTNGQYAYIVVPNKNTAAEMNSYVATQNIVIARNSDTVQTVFNKTLGLWEMVFYKANALFQNDSIKVWTSAPATLMLRKGAGNSIVGYIADPTRSLANIKVYVNWPGMSNVRYVTLSLPSSPYNGSSVFFTIDAYSQIYQEAPANTVIYSVNAKEDTYVNQGSNTATKNLNYGQASSLIVKKNSSTSQNNRESYFKFSLDTVSVNPAYIQSVKLKVVVKSLNVDGMANYNWILKFVPNDTWSAGSGGNDGITNNSSDITTGLTWNNSRDISTGATSIIATTMGYQPVGSVVYFDVTAQFISELAGDKKLSLMLYGDTGGDKTDASFYSSDCGLSDSVPQLVITYLPIPASNMQALGVSEDTYADQANAGNNYGSATSIYVKKNSTTTINNREGYLKFDLGNLQLNSSLIQNVKLRLKVKSVNAGGAANYNWIVKYLSSDIWSAGTLNGAVNANSDPITGITWNNSRSLSTAATNILASSTGWQPAGSIVDFDITSQFLMEYKGDKILSLLVFGDNGDSKADAQFYSMEGPSDSIPELIISSSESTTPLKLISFNVRKNNFVVLLQWQTAQEVNTSYTEIYRSVDGVNFEKIGSVDMAGNKQGPSNYQLTDYSPCDGNNYYQLKLVDLDGKYVLSNVLHQSMERSVTQSSLCLAPNPANNFVSIISNQTTRLQLFTGNGILIKEMNVSKDKTIRLDISELPAGLYYIKNVTSLDVKKLMVVK